MKKLLAIHSKTKILSRDELLQSRKKNSKLNIFQYNPSND